MASHLVKLDKSRKLRYTGPAIVALDDICGINATRPSTYIDFSPRKLRDLLWAGQLHEKVPLEREQVADYIPTDTVAYGEMCGVVMAALTEALGVKDDEKAPTTPAAGGSA